jgi:hypothetical protein
MTTQFVHEDALIEALHISPKLSCDDRIAILREALRLSAFPRMTAPTNGSGGEGLEIDIEATSDRIAKHLSAVRGGRYHAGAYSAAKAGAMMAFECAAATPPAQVGAATDSGEGVERTDLLSVEEQERLAWLETEIEEDPFRPLFGAIGGPDEELMRNGHEIAELEMEVLQLRLKAARLQLASPTKPVADSVEAVHQFRRVGCAGWYDGQPEPTDGPGPHEVRTLYASMPSTDQEGLVAELIEALEWYGEQARLARLIHREGDAGRHALAEDGGKKAASLLTRARQIGSEEV